MVQIPGGRPLPSGSAPLRGPVPQPPAQGIHAGLQIGVAKGQPLPAAYQAPDLSSSARTGPAAPMVSLFAPQLSAPGTDAGFATLSRSLNDALQLHKKDVPARLQQSIQFQLRELGEALAAGQPSQSPEQQERVRGAIAALGRGLAQADLLKPQVKQAFNDLIQTTLAAQGASQGLTVSLERKGTGLVGLSAHDARTGSLTESQRDWLADAQSLIRDVERAKVTTGKLTPERLLLLSLRDELLRRRLEMNMVKQPDYMPTGESVEKDLGVVQNLLDTVDSALSGTRDLPPNMLADLQELTRTVSTAGDGQIADAVKDLKHQTASSKLDEIGRELAEQARLDKPDLPAISENLKALNEEMGKLGAEQGARLGETTRELTRALQDGSAEGGAELQRLMRQASDQLREIGAEGQQIKVPHQLNQIVDLVTGGIGDGPPDIGKGVGELIRFYSLGMNAVESHLPPLLFPITMPTPMVYSADGNTFILPAGSKLSQDRKTKAYTIDAPGFLMQTGGTTVQSNQATIKLGKTLDQLKMASLSVDDGDNRTLLSKVDAQINRTNRSALIRADHVSIDNSSGHVSMDNARLISQPGSFELGAKNFLYDQDGTKISLDDFVLTQNESAMGSQLLGQANNLKLDDGKTMVSAERLTMQMQENKADGSSLMRFAGEGVKVVSGPDTIEAASGSFDIVNQPDGTSAISLAAQNASWQNGNQSASATGNTSFTLLKDAAGNVDKFTVHGDDVRYTDGAQSLKVLQGDLVVDYGETGLVKGVIAKADQIGYTGEGQALNATGGQIKLDYDDKGQLAGLSGDITHLDYSGNGQSLLVENGHVDAAYGPNGVLSQVNAGAGKLDFKGADGEAIQALDTKLGVTYHENGKLAGITASSGQVDLQYQGDKLKLLEAGASVQYNENGTLSQISAGVGKVDYTSAAGDHLTANDIKGNILYDADGKLRQISAEAGDVNYTGEFGSLATTGKTSLDLVYGANGQLSSATAATDKLSYSGEMGQIDLSKGQISLNYDEAGNLSQAATSIGELNYKGSSGDTVKVLEGAAQLNYRPDGTLSQATASAGALHWTTAAGDKLDATGLGLQLDYGETGLLQQAKAGIKSADFVSAAGDQVKLADAAAKLNFNPDGSLNTAVASAGQIDWQNAAGDHLNVKGLDLKLDYGSDGVLSQIGASAGDISYTGGFGAITTQGQTTLNALYNDDGSLKSIAADSENIKYVGEQLTASAAKASLNLSTHANGQISQISGAAEDLKLSGSWGELVSKGTLSAQVNYNEAGGLTGVTAHADQLNYAQAGQALALTNANLALTYDDKGNLSSGLASIQSGAYTGDFGSISLSDGGQVKLDYGANGQLSQISAGVKGFNYTGEQGKLDLAGAHFNAVYGADGLLDKINFKGEKVDFTGKTSEGKPIDFKLGGFDANLLLNDDGSQKFSFTGQDLALQLDQHHVGIPSIKTLDLSTTPEGAIAAMNLHLDGHNTYSNPDLTAALDNLEAHYKQEGNTLTASFDKLAVDLKTQSTQIEALGGKLYNDDKLLSLHVDSASVVKALEQELKVKVENVDLIVTKTEAGGVSSADLLVGQADALVSGMNLMVRTQNGDQVRLHVGMSEDGSFLKEAFLQIPTGGEIKLSKDDMNVTLGGGQKLAFSQDGQGLYTFRGEGLNVNATTKDAAVRVNSGTAQVSLDTRNGALIIDEIRGLDVDVALKDQNIKINVKEMEGFLVKATGISGLAQGAAIHLVPTGDGSKLTAEISTSYEGIPIKVAFKDVHELKALGTIQPNRAHVYFGDPSGRGEVKINAGPLEMKGSAIEFVAQYHTYNPQRMLSSLGKALSSDGVEIFKGVQVEADGVIRAQTPWKNGLHAGMTVMLPRPVNFSQGQDPFDPDPVSARQFNRGLNDGAAGLVFELGGKGTSKNGTTTTVAAHAGLVPGSYVSIDQTQGSSSLAGVPLPKHYAIPTTAIGGLTFRSHGQETRVDAMVGGYVNPGAFGPKEIVAEGSKYGAYGGVNWRKKDYTIGFSTTVDLSKPSKPDVGAMVTFGVNF